MKHLLRIITAGAVVMGSTSFGSTKTTTDVFKSTVKYNNKIMEVEYTTVYKTDSRSRGALFHFHGDGGRDSYQSSIGSLKNLVDKYDINVVAVKAPYSFSWQREFDGNQEVHTFPKAHAFDQFRQFYTKKFNIDPNKTYLSGISGGANFLGGNYIPIYGKNFKGGMILLCGGATSATYRDNSALFRTMPDFRKSFKVYQYIGTGDHLFTYAQALKKDYTALGHPVNMVWPKLNGHCTFPVFEKLEEGLKWVSQ